MKFFSALLVVVSGLAAISSGPLRAQPLNSVSRAEQQKIEQAYKRKVAQSVFGSCNKTAPIKDVRQRSTACNCYAEAYVNRYSAQELFNLTQWHTKNPGNGTIALLMLSPERMMCKIP